MRHQNRGFRHARERSASVRLVPKRWFGVRRWVVLLVAVPLVLEILLRISLPPSRLYSRFHTVPEYNEWRNQVRFFGKYADETDPEAFQKRAGFDPRLGWDYDLEGDRIRGDAIFTPTPSRGTLRLVTLGDSYVYGSEMPASDNFSALLTAAPNSLEALNMGVPGYGLDQAVLKYLHHGKQYRPQIVVLAIYLTDYERSSINFTFFAKPKFVWRGDGYELETANLAEPWQELQRIGALLEGRSYLVELVRNLGRKLSHWGRTDAVFFDQTDPIISHILRVMVASLESDQRLIVVHIPGAESFVETDAYRAELSNRLLAMYATLDLDVINLSEAFVADKPATEVYREYYVQRSDGSVGHLNKAGHAKIAALIERKVR